jgi:hypothetical protein
MVALGADVSTKVSQSSGQFTVPIGGWATSSRRPLPAAGPTACYGTWNGHHGGCWRTLKQMIAQANIASA